MNPKNCQKCSNPIYHDQFCKRCFCEVIERRIRKYVRLKELISKHDILVINNPLCEYLIKSIVQDMPVTIKQQGEGKNVLAFTMDDEIEWFLDIIFAGKDLEQEIKQQNKDIKLLITITDKEAQAFAQAKNIMFPQKQRKYQTILEQLEQKHKETRYSLFKSVEGIKKILVNENA